MGHFDPFKKFLIFLIINKIFSTMYSPCEYPTSTPASCASSPPPSKKRGEEGRKSACCTTMPGLTLLRPPASSWKSWAGLRYPTHHTPPTWRLPTFTSSAPSRTICAARAFETLITSNLDLPSFLSASLRISGSAASRLCQNVGDM